MPPIVVALVAGGVQEQLVDQVARALDDQNVVFTLRQITCEGVQESVEAWVEFAERLDVDVDYLGCQRVPRRGRGISLCRMKSISGWVSRWS